MSLHEHAKHFIPADFGSENLRICFAIIESYVLLDEKEFLQVRYDFKIKTGQIRGPYKQWFEKLYNLVKCEQAIICK